MTLRYLYGHKEIVAPWVAGMIPHMHGRPFDNCMTIGVVDGDDELIAGIIYHNYLPEHGRIELSCAALPDRQWLTRTTLRVMYHFPFVQLGCQLAVHGMLASNMSLRRQFKAIGCVEYEFPRAFGRHKDAIICLLTDEAWRANKIMRRIFRPESAQRKAA